MFCKLIILTDGAQSWYLFSLSKKSYFEIRQWLHIMKDLCNNKWLKKKNHIER